ncbi:MAG: transposase [Opitutaceae bacterium]|nr:transposase [Opitutaceae bacterium]
MTFRLADSIPQEKLRPLQAAREQWLSAHPEPWDEATHADYQLRFSDQIESWLDAGYGSRALARPDIRDATVACLTQFEDTRLHLPAAVIMPNHVHALIEPLAGNPLATLLKGIKGASARAANRLLGQTGTFWLDESYDHIVRNESEFTAFVRYIESNPTRAHLSPEQYWLRLPK